MSLSSLDKDKPFVLIGAGGHSRVVFDCLTILGCKIVAYYSENKAEWLERLSVKHIEESQLHGFASRKFQMAMSFIGGTPEKLETRLQEMERLCSQGAIFPSIIHPYAIVSKSCNIKTGVQILAGAVVNTNATLNDCCVINSNSTIEHDSFVGKGVHISPNATVLGEVQIGDNTYIGSSSVLIQKSIIKKKSFIKALSIYK